MAIVFKFAIPIVNVFLVILTAFFGIYFSKYYSDYVYLKSNDPVEIEGRVTGYSISVSGDDLTVTNSWPIIMVSESKEKITLNVIDPEELKEDEIYSFIYLPNTKIAEVINNIK